MNFTGKKVLVIGTGLSGIGAAQLLSTAGASVTILDQNEKAQEEQIRGKFDGALTKEGFRDAYNPSSCSIASAK